MNRKITTNRRNRSENRAERHDFTGRAARITTVRTLAAALAALILPLLLPVTAYAGDINSAEQGILSVISEKHEYEGAYYKVTDGYIAKVTEYLSQDGIDMGKREANDYIAQFRANIGVGIASGYMEKVGDVEGAGTGADDGTGTGTGTGAGSGTGAGGSTGSGSGDSTGTGTDAGSNADAGTDTGAGNGTDTAAGTGTDNGAGAGNAAGVAAVLGTDPEGDGPIEDNTTGSTSEGAVEYVVLPMDEQTMYVQGIEVLSVHEEAYKDSSVIGEVKEGEPVKVTGGASTGWAQIAFGEKTGYVSAAYLRTQGYMDRKEAEKKAAEEAEQKAQEEARKAEEAQKAQEEARKAEEEKKAQEAAAAEAEETEAQAKDYSDAKPVENSINLGMIALVIVVVCVAALGGVLFYHKKKSRSGKR